ncbi:uncharacterized protein YjbJ (UPF0337 family) [Methanocalculus alkaliphilus]|uniref:CsbD family protein n=1 Tax=Methanocalculus alkaliphilus TaxID=768730 RepID=UPI00209FE561|nr:hypothetical protein [Methanocalculus alkaliphilus]MCP1715688.1 uncharacterized protein YjbJ (UPF0337 family) [Methanocalculus alkaliphilus]
MAGWSDEDMAIEEDEIRGRGKQIKGRVREGGRKLTGDRTEQVKGKIEQVKGKGQKEIGTIKRKAKK